MNITNDTLAKVFVPDSIKIRITKIKELEDAEYPNNKPVGETHVGYVRKNLLIPKIGTQYNLESIIEKNDLSIHAGYWFMTSMVTEIINSRTFKTLNSVYKIELL